MSDNVTENQVTTTEYTLNDSVNDVSTDGLLRQDGAGGSYHTGPKLGHMCCGGCCDMRRAVIIVNIVNASLVLVDPCRVVGASFL